MKLSVRGLGALLCLSPLALAGCSDPYAEERAAFVEGCSIQMSEAVCDCAFDKLIENRSDEEIKALTSGQVSSEAEAGQLFLEAAGSIQRCQREQG